MLKKSKLLSAAVVATAAFMASPSHADTMGTPKISAMSILNGLENPWDMAFAPNGDMFFTEKCKGFSVKTALPAFKALVIYPKCSCVGLEIITASTFGSLIQSS